MKLRHLKYPSIQVNLPIGGSLRFKDFECEVSEETAQLLGDAFFDTLLAKGDILIEDQVEVVVTTPKQEKSPASTDSKKKSKKKK